ncbi:sigma-E factor regulatory protein RseB domain-containing protein [Streptomonospora wellingtoniae]|uniref:Sigma-E factor regulatory protein RseB domain-containing protein n=1 Tax=Streptomonospora wellingtoniae TaxID=3075544 RepID=A0ABU2KT52_9ACTN|nr:sigma-E factor regulatory protein RseB domain-containing protein [Streptomonospora sp. DSM 45055]MDT0302308.1 sigma-E factor regulatory protein RseB domain-containing protein [Streptomonospora sp. DSM 45055]
MPSLPSPPRAAQRSGLPARVPLVLLSLSLVFIVLLPGSATARADDVPAPGEDDGMALLRRAADSARSVSFEGVQLVNTGADARLVDVVHRAGEATGYRYIGGTRPDRAVVVGETPPLRKADGVLLDQLAANYRVTRAGAGRMCGRSATVLEARRADGTVAGRMWIDRSTGLPLRRETRDRSGALVHAAEFVEVRVDGDPEPLAAQAERARPWSEDLSDGELADLRERGWHIPERPSWNLRLVRAWTKPAEGGRVVHLAYSDGLSVVSVFAQRGRLPGGSEGTGEGAGKVVERDGAGGTGTGQQRMWDADGFVYTAMGRVPSGLLDAAADGFPDADPLLFWARVLRGFDHISATVTE